MAAIIVSLFEATGRPSTRLFQTLEAGKTGQALSGGIGAAVGVAVGAGVLTGAGVGDGGRVVGATPAVADAVCAGGLAPLVESFGPTGPVGLEAGSEGPAGVALACRSMSWVVEGAGVGPGALHAAAIRATATS